MTRKSLIILIVAAALSMTLFFCSAARKSPTFDEVYYIGLACKYAATGGLSPTMPTPLGLGLIGLPFRFMDMNPPLTRVSAPTDDFAELTRFSHDFLFSGRNDRDKIVFLARFLPTLVSIAACLLLAWFAGRKLGALGGLLAGCLLLFEPNWIANGRLANMDAIAASFQLALVILLILFMERPGAGRAAAVGLFFAFATAAKISSIVFAVPVFAVLIYPAIKRRERISVKNALSCLLIAIVAAIATLGLVYGDFISPPLNQGHWKSGLFNRLAATPIAGDVSPPLADKFLAGLDLQFLFQGAWPAVYRGRVLEHRNLFFYPFLLLIKTPLLHIALALAGLTVLLVRGRQSPGWQASWFPVLLSIFLLVLYAGLGRQLGVRYLLLLYPLACLIAANAVELPKIIPSRKKAVGVVLACFVVIGLIAPHARAFPDYLAFTNVAAGGMDQGWRFCADSNLDWGQDLPALKRYVDEKEIDEIRLGYFGLADPGSYGINFRQLPNLAIVPWVSRTPPDSETLYGAGWYVISVTTLYSPYLPRQRGYYGRFLRMEPVDVIGGSLLVYKID